ncbi:MAG: hypothetical protein IJ698_00240 [Prevotella sp.]|nr:hypothetical protein [Prevotella sp.]
MKETLEDHEERITTLENGGELLPPKEPSKRYLYVDGGNLIARVVDDGEESVTASEAFTVTLAAFDDTGLEYADSQQQVSFAVGDALSKEIQIPEEGNLYIVSVSPRSYDGMDWIWEEPPAHEGPVDPEPQEPVDPGEEE